MVEVDGVVLTACRDKRAERATPAEESGQRGVDTYANSNHREDDQRNGHRERSLMRRVVGMGFLVLRTPEDAEVEAEHVEGCHGGDARHDPTHHGAVLEASGDDLVLRAEAREEGNTGNGQTGDEERHVSHGHVLAQTTHERHLVGVDGMDDATGAEEQAGLEHGVGEQVEHASHVAQLRVIVEHSLMAGQANAEGHHHEGNLRNRREGQHTLDVGLGTSHGSGIESGDDTHPHDDRHGLRGILNPQREHASHLEHTGHNHRGGMDEGRDRRRAFHGVGQPDVQREHGTLTGTTDEHQHQCRGQDECSGSHSLGGTTLDEGRGTGTHHDVAGKRETERLRVVAEDEDTDEEEHVGKARHDECLLRGSHSSAERIVEADEQV